LDIYIEEIRVAVEYQGDQHHRDKKKFERCRLNGCQLIYVYPGYTFNEVVRQIEEVAKAIKKICYR
jgi:very-short-patch-repair endonuclease